MEKISSTPLAHNNNKKLTEISSTTTTMSQMLNLDFVDGMPKLAESSVRATVPLRANFQKSNTCGSLFANCNCGQHSHTAVPLITETDCEQEKPKSDRLRRKSPSFSHPDTPVVFTEENRYPVPVTFDLRASQETVFNSGNQKVEVKHSKRSSSPNIGEFTTSNVDIHPEFKVQVSPKSSALQDAPRRRPILKKGSKSFPSASRSPFRSFDSVGDRTFSSSYSYSVDEESEELETSEPSIVTDLDASSTSLAAPPQTATSEQSGADERSSRKPDTDTAAKFFLVWALFSFVHACDGLRLLSYL